MNAIDLDILLPALIAGLVVLATHIPFGMRVLQRGVIFADLAVAQIAGLGVIFAGLLDIGGQPLWLYAIAAAGALIGAGLLTWIERHAADVKEACIGLTFVLAASLGILLLSHDAHAGERLQNLLVGQILWTSDTQLHATALLSAALLIVWRKLQHSKNHFTFYALFALAVTAAVQIVGIYLVFASLIVPALATHRMTARRMPLAFAIGIAGYTFGLLFSIWFDLPAGAAIVWAMAVAGLLATTLKRSG